MISHLPCGHARDVEAELAAAASATLLFFPNLENDISDSLEISAFRSCVLFKEEITIEYGGGSSYLSSSDARGDVDVIDCVVTTDV